MQNPQLAQFADYVRRLLATTGLSGVKLGMLYTTGAKPGLLALRAELSSVDTETAPERFAIEGLAAYKAVGPVERMEALLVQLDRGALRSFVGAIVLPDEPAIEVPATNWQYHDHSGSSMSRGVTIRAQAGSLRDGMSVANPDVLDRAIAVESRHQIASFSRLAARFVGKPLEFWQSSREFEIVAPWPIAALRAEVQGTRLRFEIDALPGCNRDRIIVNIESEHGDSRVDGASIQWTRSDPGPHVTHIGVISPVEARLTALNVFYDGLPEVWLRHPFQPIASGRPVQDPYGFPGRLARRGVTAETRTDVSVAPEPVLARITRIHIERFRGLRDVTLALEPLTVLVGPNQAGKSSVLDVLDVIARGAQRQLYDALVRRRGGLQRIVWRGDEPHIVQIDIDIAVDDRRGIRYQVVLGLVGEVDYRVERERIYRKSGEAEDRWQLVLDVEGGRAEFHGNELRAFDQHELFIAQFPAIPNLPDVQHVRAALATIAVYPYLATGVTWADIEGKTMRAPARLEPDARLAATGRNLAAALHRMREESSATWDDYLAIVRLAFPDLRDIRFPTAAGSQVELAWHDRRFERPFYATELSDGTLAYLANVCALLQPGSSLVALDEPERSLHPDALYRLIGAARMVSGDKRVVIATQSDRLIGFLDDIPESVVIVRSGQRGTELVRPGVDDADDLKEWLRKFSLADMRRELETWGEE